MGGEVFYKTEGQVDRQDEATSPFFAILRTRLKILKYPSNVTAGAEIVRKLAGINLLMTIVKFQHSSRKGD